MSLAPFTDSLLALALITIRIECALRFCPAFSSNLITGWARRTAVIMLALLLLPRVLPHLTPHPNGFTLLWIILREILLGTCFGFLAAIPFYVGEMVGNMIDNQRGATMGEVFSPMTGAQDAPTATFLIQFLVAYFYLSGALPLFLGALYGSYLIFPLGADTLSFIPTFPTIFLGVADEMLRGVIVLAAPAVILMVLATVGLGFINRSSPQLNVFFLSMPIKSALGLLILLLSLRHFAKVIFPKTWLLSFSTWFQ